MNDTDPHWKIEIGAWQSADPYVNYFTGEKMDWVTSYKLVGIIQSGNWKHPDGNPSTFVHTRYGAQKMYYYGTEAVIDDCIHDGQWHV